MTVAEKTYPNPKACFLKKETCKESKKDNGAHFLLYDEVFTLHPEHPEQAKAFSSTIAYQPSTFTVLSTAKTWHGSLYDYDKKPTLNYTPSYISSSNYQYTLNYEYPSPNYGYPSPNYGFYYPTDVNININIDDTSDTQTIQETSQPLFVLDQKTRKKIANEHIPTHLSQLFTDIFKTPQARAQLAAAVEHETLCFGTWKHTDKVRNITFRCPLATVYGEDTARLVISSNVYWSTFVRLFDVHCAGLFRKYVVDTMKYSSTYSHSSPANQGNVAGIVVKQLLLQAAQ